MQVTLNSIKFFTLRLVKLPVYACDYQSLCTTRILVCAVGNTGFSKYLTIKFIHAFRRELSSVPQVMVGTEMRTNGTVFLSFMRTK